MKHAELLEKTKKLGIKIKQREIQAALGFKRVGVIGQRASRNSNYSMSEILKICKFKSINPEYILGFPIHEDETSTQELKNKEQVLTCIKIIEYQLQAIKKLIS